MPRQIDQKQRKCDPYHKVGSKDPKVAQLGEKMWHNNKEENESNIVWRAHIHLEEKNYQLAIFKHGIYHGIILNFLSNTTLFYCATNQEGAQSVLIDNADDKRQITGTIYVNNSCKFLLVQLIYSSVTDSCHPKVKFPDSSHITHTSNHWSNEPIVIDFLSNIIFPYLEKKRKDLKLEKNPKALSISCL